MTLIGIGPIWLYRSFFSLFSLTTKGNQADETLTRVYFRKYKTLSINRAGKHHRGFYPSRYPCNCSLVIYNQLDTLNLITQSINLSGFFYLQFEYTNHSLVLQFSFNNKRRGVFVISAGFGSICLFISTNPPSMLQNVGPFRFTFDLAIIAVFFSFIIVLRTNVEKHSMARASLYFVLSPLTFCIPVGLTKHVHEYKIGSRSYWEPFGCLTFETTKKQQHPRNSATPRNPYGNSILWMTKTVQFQFLIGCFKQFF